ncbi:MAG: hypothetical protein FWG99_01430 [Treponema sp.]|nr:hypothetical protein [Treponema sp.]
MNTVYLAILLTFSGFAMNLILQCALGIRGDTSNIGYKIDNVLIKLLVIYITVMLLWFILEKINYLFSSELLIYIILFPLSSVVYDGFIFLAFRFIIRKEDENNSGISFCGGICAAVLFISLNIAKNIVEAAALTLGFILGIFLSIMIIREIRRRAALEAVPRFLRGSPLLLISMGLLSLVFTASALIFFKMLGA